MQKAAWRTRCLLVLPLALAAGSAFRARERLRVPAGSLAAHGSAQAAAGTPWPRLPAAALRPRCPAPAGCCQPSSFRCALRLQAAGKSAALPSSCSAEHTRCARCTPALGRRARHRSTQAGKLRLPHLRYFPEASFLQVDIIAAAVSCYILPAQSPLLASAPHRSTAPPPVPRACLACSASSFALLLAPTFARLTTSRTTRSRLPRPSQQSKTA